MNEYVALDIGGTAIKHGVLDQTLCLLEEGQTPTNAHLGAESILATLQQLVSEYCARYTVQGICISSTGVIDIQSGVVLQSGEHMPGYEGMHIKERMEEAFPIPCEVENDVNCAGLAEAVCGAGTGCSPCLCVTVGTKIGGCLVLDGNVYHGYSGSACEVGYMHMQGSRFEDIASAGAMVARVSARKGKALDGREVFRLAHEGDAVCREEIARMCMLLAQGLADLVYVLNPQVIVLGGGIMAEEDYLRPLLEEELTKRVVPEIYRDTKLAFARNGNRAGMLGACLHFRHMRRLRAGNA